MLIFFVRLLYVLLVTWATMSFCFAPAVEGVSGVRAWVTEHRFLAFTLIWLVAMSVLLVDVMIPRKRVVALSAIYFGMIIGLLLSYLFNLALSPLFDNTTVFAAGEGRWLSSLVTTLSIVIFSYLSITFLLQTKDDFRFVIPYVEFSRELRGGRPILLDSSALIDGRVADIVETNIVDSEILVPAFVVQEVQQVADSGDKVRKARGRRGLDVLNRLKSAPHITVRVLESDGHEQHSTTIDQRLIEVARQLSARVMTNDFNLKKVAGVHGIPVINLNDLSNCLGPRFVPGEKLRIRLIKEGEGANQGVGYLDDGTMVVCENGAREVGNEVEIEVTSTLQKTAGRMIFGKMVGGESASSMLRRT